MFDAGSIEARLTLDRDAFQRGLAESRAEAERFAAGRYDAKLGVSGAGRALAETAMVRQELERVDRQRVAPDVRSDGLAALARRANDASGRMGGLATAALTLTPALVPIGTVAAAGLGGFTSALTAAGVGLAGFAAVALPTFRDVAAAATKTGAAQKRALADLGPGAAGAVQAFKRFTETWQDFRQSFQPQIFTLMQAGMDGVRRVLPALRPMISGVADALTGLARDAGRALQGSFWQGFFRWLGREAGPAVTAFARTLGNLVHGFAGMMMAFTPLAHSIEAGMVRLTARFAAWGQNLGAGAGFQRFLAGVYRDGPVVGRALGSLAQAAAAIAAAFGRAGPAVLQMVTVLARLVTVIARSPVGAFVLSLTPLLVLAVKVAGPVLALARVVTVLSAAFTAAEAVATVFGVGLGALLAPVAAVAVAVVGLGVGAYMLVKHWTTVRNALGAVWHTILNTARTVFNSIRDFIGRVGRTIVDALKADWNLAKTVVVGIWHGLESAAKAVFNAIRNFVGAATRDAGRLAAIAWRDLVVFTKHAWQNILDAVRSVAGNLVGFVRSLPRRILSALGNLAGLLFNAGVSIINGLWNGLKATAGKVLAFIADLGGKIKGVFSKVLGIFSPSTVFHGLGRDLMQGLHDGVRAGAPQAIIAVDDTARKLRDRMTAAAGETARRLSGLTIDRDTAISRARAAGAQAISGLRGRGAARAAARIRQEVQQHTDAIRRHFATLAQHARDALTTVRRAVTDNLSNLAVLKSFEQAVGAVATKVAAMPERIRQAVIASQLAGLEQQQRTIDRTEQDRQTQRERDALLATLNAPTASPAEVAVAREQLTRLDAQIASTRIQRQQEDLRAGISAQGDQAAAAAQQRLAGLAARLGAGGLSVGALQAAVSAVGDPYGVTLQIPPQEQEALLAGQSLARQAARQVINNGPGQVVNVTVPQPAAAHRPPDPHHLAALMGTALRHRGRRR